MDDVIQRLVEIDRKCVERVEAAKAKKLDAQTNMNEKRKEIYDGFVTEQNKKIEAHKAELMNKVKVWLYRQMHYVLRLKRCMDTALVRKVIVIYAGNSHLVRW